MTTSTLEEAIKKVSAGLRDLSGQGKEFFDQQSGFHQSMSKFVETLSDPKMIAKLNDDHKKQLATFLKPYQGLVQHTDFFGFKKDSGHLETISNIINPQHAYFSQMLPHFKKCSIAQPKFNLFLQTIRKKYPGTYQKLSNTISGKPSICPFDPVILSSTLITPMQHIIRCNLMLQEMVKKIREVMKDVERLTIMMISRHDEFSMQNPAYAKLSTKHQELQERYLAIQQSQRFINKFCDQINTSKKWGAPPATSPTLFKTKSAGAATSAKRGVVIEVPLRKAHSSPL